MNQPIEKQVGGDHYKRLGDYQPWIVCRKWFSEEEFIGAIKKDAIAYLCREKHKGCIEDIKKALHTLEIGLYLLEDRKCKTCQTNLLQDTDGFFVLIARILSLSSLKFMECNTKENLTN